MTHAKSLLKNKNIKFICGIDKSINQRKIFNKRYKIPSFTKLNDIELLKSNFIVLSTPNHTHLKYIQKILLYKIYFIYFLFDLCLSKFFAYSL